MKKIYLIALLTLVAVSVNAQIYTKRMKVDKFDDVEFCNIEKTLVTTHFSASDSTITFEVKGSEPVTYYIYSQPFLSGSRTDEVELAGNIFGCEENYIAYDCSLHDAPLEPDYSNCQTKLDSLIESVETSSRNLENSTSRFKSVYNYVTITHRTISAYSFKRRTSGDFPYKTDMWWVTYQDGSRIIYRKD